MLEEFEIGTTAPLHSYPIPIGATGFAAGKIWEQVSADPTKYSGEIDVSAELAKLGDATLPDSELIDAVFKIIEKVRQGQHRS